MLYYTMAAVYEAGDADTVLLTTAPYYILPSRDRDCRQHSGTISFEIAGACDEYVLHRVSTG